MNLDLDFRPLLIFAVIASIVAALLGGGVFFMWKRADTKYDEGYKQGAIDMYNGVIRIEEAQDTTKTLIIVDQNK